VVDVDVDVDGGCCDSEWLDGSSVGVNKQSLSGGMELIESFVVWRVVVDLLLDML